MNDFLLVVLAALFFWILGLTNGSDAEKRSFEKDAKAMGQTRIGDKVYKIELIKESE